MLTPPSNAFVIYTLQDEDIEDTRYMENSPCWETNDTSPKNELRKGKLHCMCARRTVGLISVLLIATRCLGLMQLLSTINICQTHQIDYVRTERQVYNQNPSVYLCSAACRVAGSPTWFATKVGRFADLYDSPSIAPNGAIRMFAHHLNGHSVWLGAGSI